MPITLEQLYKLLPAVYRLRDAERGEPLKALIAILAEQANIVEVDIERLYDNWFIETCDEWVLPYIGDLLNVHGLYTLPGSFSQRARVANTLTYRRRKGTAAMLEQLARDVTGWDARVVEFFKLLATTQHLNHLRPQNVRTPDLRDLAALEMLNAPFDTIAHTADVRHIASRHAKYNIPNIGIFLWRLQSYPLNLSPAVAVDERRFFIHPLGCNMSLFTHPITEDEITHLAEPLNVPNPVSRLRLRNHFDDYYGAGRSLLIKTDDGFVDRQEVIACNLDDVDPEDASKGWAHTVPPGKVAIDPVLGRLAFADVQAQSPRVTFYYGFSADLGGGEYDRSATLGTEPAGVEGVPVPHATVQFALSSVVDTGVVEITDTGRYIEPGLAITVSANQRVELRAANQHRPTIVLTNDLNTPQDLTISGGAGAELILNGLLIIGGMLRVSGSLKQLTLQHCTLVPGLSLNPLGQAMHKKAPSLIVTTDAELTTVVIEHSIVGELKLADNVSVEIRDSIVDGVGTPMNAITGAHRATIERSTIIGTTQVTQLDLASETIFTHRLTVQRRQVGCVRFSYVPENSGTPRRHCCQPDLALKAAKTRGERKNTRMRLVPTFTSLQYGDATYAQLNSACAEEITTGAEDGSEMGAFSLVKQARRLANLRAALDEYLRFGLEAGIFFAS